MVELNLSDTLKLGIKARRTGRLKASYHYFSTILEVAPDHSDANHNMGLLKVALGKPKGSIRFFKKAISTNPSVSQYWVSYIGELIN